SRPTHRRRARGPHRRGCEVDGLRGRQGRRGQPRAPRMGGRPVDDAVRPPVAWTTRAVASQRGRHAGGRRSGGGTGRRRAAIVIELHRLTKVFGSTRAVDDLTCSIQPGVVTGFLGPNGAGKSTTMRMIVGLDRPTAGTATIDGRNYHELHRPLRTVGA